MLLRVVRDSYDVTKTSRKAKTHLHVSSWTCKVSSFHLQLEIMTSRLIRMLISDLVRSLNAKYGPDRYRSDKSVKFGTELP